MTQLLDAANWVFQYYNRTLFAVRCQNWNNTVSTDPRSSKKKEMEDAVIATKGTKPFSLNKSTMTGCPEGGGGMHSKNPYRYYSVTKNTFVLSKKNK